MKKYIFGILLLCASTISVKAQTDLQRTARGVQYVIFTHNPGEKIKQNDVITIDVIQKTDKDSVISSTYTMGHPIKIQVQPSQALTDMMDIFPLLAANDSALVKMPADSVFNGHEESRPPFFPKGSNINFYIKVQKIQSLNDAIAERNADIEKVKSEEGAQAAKYIADNKLVVRTTPSGLKYVITKTSLKPRPLTGDTVSVNYVGKLLSGQVFDSNIAAVAKMSDLDQPGRTYEPIKFPVNTSQVIKGWDEGLLLLHEGEKAIFIIPSALAYGNEGSGPIPPASTLVFDVELVSVKRIKHAIVAKKPLAKKHHYPVKKTNN
ncbi:FKBP-type peptidyl-prolyl cis-trans isomerase [Mucilaginibacter sp. L196]|uniref:FKBP-type peptidyl-prolyl cis-trans isomerase n=1 Tax=Mucilaginibacter sp. L196 TaxID=1641870 RepID=UPI00131B90C5|nr:FKBP-type peptidyl-prolyl cis-trans isomerase [Mucilaginibacter sp. L196]